DLGLKVGRVDLEEQVALVHRLVIPDRHADDRAGNPRGDADDVGTDLAIAGPGVLQVAVVEGGRRPSRQAHQGQGDHVVEQLCFHGKNTSPMSELNRTTGARSNIWLRRIFGAISLNLRCRWKSLATFRR